MDSSMMNYPPGDPRLVDKIVCQLKSQGIFDRFRKECIADVDTKPAYQNLHQRVEGTVASFLATQEWRQELNKNQLRDSLRKHIHESGFLDIGVERIVDQVVNPKILTVLLPQIEDVVYGFLGLEKPKKMFSQNVAALLQGEVAGCLGPRALASLQSVKAPKPLKMATLEDLLPKDLDPISPGSVGGASDDEESGGGGEEDAARAEERLGEEEDSSPPFEPLAPAAAAAGAPPAHAHDESSMDSHLSGISGLTSHGSQASDLSFGPALPPAPPPPDALASHDSQLSKVTRAR